MEGRDTRLDRTVAIKVLKDRFSERFERESRAISYLALSFLPGNPLRQPYSAALREEHAVALVTHLAKHADERILAAGLVHQPGA